jgi:hypothetical protein
MDNFEFLKKVFGDKLIKSEEGEYGKPCIKLEETKSEPNYSITIQQTPQDAIAIKTDKFSDLKSFFKCSSDIGQCKRADFVIIAIANKKLIFIELCKVKKQAKEVEQQLKGAQCVIEYCRSIGDKFYDCDSFLDGYSSYFVSIDNIGVSKKSSIVPSGKNNEPNKFLKISAPHRLPFNALCRTK